ncbi:hypothetical protein RRM51_000287 [Aeromonas veronii]|uniref:hypothetical protein n=1 Tax=Aeromonas veronii TaxID=654 RepID=UPI00226CA28F|nr:hypothetical protein [Aeromonas veronii]ELI6420928.1 hypothetical protein [Aeromonas veronii]MCX9112660.1 hypothetical protein [Aeromonas veronii]
MNQQIENVVILSALILLVIYISMSHRFMRKPVVFIIIGFLLCIVSAYMLSTFDVIETKLKTENNNTSFDIIKNIIMLSIAALGGGLISAGMSNKATIEHNKELNSYKERLRCIEDDIESLRTLLNADHVNDGEKEIHIRMISIKEFKKDELISKIKELEKHQY